MKQILQIFFKCDCLTLKALEESDSIGIGGGGNGCKPG